MALIYCPNCGKKISDQAMQCPHCAYKLIKSDIQDPKPVKNKKISKGKLAIVLAVSLSLVIVCLGIYFYMNSLHVDYIRIQNWKYDSESSTESYEHYDAEIVSNETKPFVALINYTDSPSRYPTFIFMEDGKGRMHKSVEADNDPSKEYQVTGYLSGKVVTESIIKNVREDEDETDYYDWDWESNASTSVYTELEIELNNNWTGMLVFDLKNDANTDVEYNCATSFVNGKGKYLCFLTDLPLKSRGIGFTVVPKYFTDVKKISSDNYSVSKEFSTSKSKYGYSGEIEYAFDGYQDGLVLYFSYSDFGRRRG